MSNRKAFTLVELLVVIAIIVILISILVPSLDKAMAASQKAKCGSNLSAIGKGVGTYLNDSISRSYPSTGAEFALFGKRGEPHNSGNNFYTFDTYDSDRRPLNKYLGVTGKGSEVKVAECPSDSGDDTVDVDGSTSSQTVSNDPTGTGQLDPVLGTTTTMSGTGTATASNVYKTVGSSYSTATLVDAANPGLANRVFTGIQAAFGTSPMRASDARPAASKILVGDSPFYGNRKSYQNSSPAGSRKHRWHSADKNIRAFSILFADYHVEFYTFPAFGVADKDIENLPAAEAGKAKPERGYW